MRSRFATLVCWIIAAATWADPALARPSNFVPETLTPNDQWQLSRSGDVCQVSFHFGSKERPLTAHLRRFGDRPDFDLTLIGRRFKLEGQWVTSKIDFGNGATQELGEIVTIAGTPALMYTSIRIDGWARKKYNEIAPHITPAQESAASVVTIAPATLDRFRLAFGSLGEPLAALRKCGREVEKGWGLDPDVQEHLSRDPVPVTDPQSWVSSADYPNEATRFRKYGSVHFRLDIDEQGRVAGCHILERTDPDLFADTACNILNARGKFVPALDQNGAPVRSQYQGLFHFNFG